jgi:oxygen-independent coproporphyrinogen-3 oxidase
MRITSLLSELPPSIDSDAIFSNWKLASRWFEFEKHSLPKPVWAQREFEHNGERAWDHLLHHIRPGQSDEALSMYIHVPFCERRCGFCDLYSIPMPETKRHMEDDFTRALMHEIQAWSRFSPLENRSVTTVHFGGGTPNYLQFETLEHIIGEIGIRLGITPQTEWALESTSRLLTDEHLTRLREMGFTRLHVGVQTLNDATRRRIGRKDTHRQVMQSLYTAMQKGFIVSVDIIYGLPGETLKQPLFTLEQLAKMGIHGFSLYQLQTCQKNKAFLKRVGGGVSDPLLNYTFFQAAEQYLRRKGYCKNFFTHFALPQDKSLYYRHAQRGEDLLGMGPTADGVFGSYRYRHPSYKEYLRAAPPALQGGMLETVAEQKVRPVSVALMAACIDYLTLKKIDAEPLLEQWLACNLLQQTEPFSDFELTANGSWFITNMIEQLRDGVDR